MNYEVKSVELTRGQTVRVFNTPHGVHFIVRELEDLFDVNVSLLSARIHRYEQVRPLPVPFRRRLKTDGHINSMNLKWTTPEIVEQLIQNDFGKSRYIIDDWHRIINVMNTLDVIGEDDDSGETVIGTPKLGEVEVTEPTFDLSIFADSLSKMMPVTETNGKQVVNARELYEAIYHGVESKTRFDDWIKRKLEKGEAWREGIDFFTILTNEDRNGARGTTNYKDYLVSLDVAKHLALMSDTRNAHTIRDYFIDVEKQYSKQILTGIPISKDPARVFLEALKVQRKHQADDFDGLLKALESVAEEVEGLKIDRDKIQQKQQNAEQNQRLSLDQEVRLLNEMTARLQADKIAAFPNIPERDQNRQLTGKIEVWGTLHNFQIILANEFCNPELKKQYSKGRLPASRWRDIQAKDYDRVIEFIHSYQWKKGDITRFKESVRKAGLAWHYGETA